MPIVQINILEGRTVEQKRKLASAVTDAICQSIGSPKENVKIIINDMKKENYASAGTLNCDL